GLCLPEMTGGFRAGAVFSTSFAQIPGFLAGHFSASWAHSMKIAALFLSIALPLCAATFNVRDFGAAGDGTVKFPPGIYLSTPLTIRTKTIFQLEAGATLLASTNQSDFMKVPGD